MAGPDRHVGDLPWGWWLRANGVVLEDGEGGRWRSVRDAFWHGRLRFPASNLSEEQLELLLRVLTTSDARWLSQGERRHDLFDGNMVFARFYQSWLASVGLLDARANGTIFEAPLTDEGRSVMRMLQATRRPDWEPLPWPEVKAAIAAADRTSADDAREAALRAFELSVRDRRYVFAREHIGTSHLVTLTGIATDARMPVRRVMWSQSFKEARERDDLFAWLAERVDRWDDWGGIAYGSGADVLTRHILTLLVATALPAAARDR